jgi:oxalate---CoA ligase
MSPSDGTVATVMQLLQKSAAQFPTAPALLRLDGESLLTYDEMLKQVTDLAIQLREAGVGPTDVVLVSMPNGPDTLVAVLASMCAAVCAPMNPDYTLAELEQHADDLVPAAVIVARETGSNVRELSRRRAIPCIEVARGRFLAASRLGPGFEPCPSDTALLLHTAGTTARPKQVPLSHANLASAATNVVASLALTPADRCLNVMPLFHSHGLIGAALSTLAAGSSIACAESMDRRVFLTWAAETRATWYTAASTIHQIVVDAPGNWQGFRFMRSASGPLAPAVAMALESRFGAPMIEVYGMTEAYQIAANPLPPGQRHLGSVGQPTGTEVRVIDQSFATVPHDVDGEIAVRGPAVFSGYSSPPGANEGVFVDGWFRTGDLGRLGADGTLTITGRIKEQINRGGEKISPREVDEALLLHPDVMEAMTFAIPDRLLGEEIGAAVVPRPGATVDLPSIRRFLNGQLAGFKVPRKLVIVDALPKSSTGKLLRIGFAEAHEEELRPPQPSSTAPLVGLSPTQEKLAALWMELLELSAPPATSDSYFDLGGTSLLTVELVIRIEEQFGVDLPVTEVAPLRTLAALADRIDSSVGEHGTARLLVPYRVHGHPTAAVLVPGAEGLAIGLIGIADALGPGLDIYLFDYPGHRHNTKPATTIEEIAGALVSELDVAGLSHRVALYGNSLGGWVVFEAGRRLQAAGSPPQAVAIGDMFSPVFNSRESPLRPSFARRLRNRIRRLLNAVRRRLRGARVHRSSATSTRRETVAVASQHARRSYRAKGYDGDVVVFRATERAASYGGALGWDRHVNGNVQVVDLDSKHSQMHIDSAAMIADTLRHLVETPPR